MLSGSLSSRDTSEERVRERSILVVRLSRALSSLKGGEGAGCQTPDIQDSAIRHKKTAPAAFAAKTAVNFRRSRLRLRCRARRGRRRIRRGARRRHSAAIVIIIAIRSAAHALGITL